MLFLSEEISIIFLQDYDQRWSYCATLTSNNAPIAIGSSYACGHCLKLSEIIFVLGSLYISKYFTEEDKKKADEMVDYIYNEYVDTVQKSEWMDETTRNNTLLKASIMSKYIGYHSKLRSPEVEEFYDSLPGVSIDNFLETGMSLILFNADRNYKRFKLKQGQDWTK